MVEMHDSIGKGTRKHVEQFRAMKVIVGSTEVALAHPSQWGGCEYPPVVPSAQLSRARAHADPSKRLLQTKAMEDTVGVRAGHNADAHFAQFGRLLEERYVDPCAA